MSTLDTARNVATQPRSPIKRGKPLRVGILVVAVVLVAGYATLQAYVRGRIDDRLQAIRSDPARPVDVRYGAFALAPLSLGFELRDVTVTDNSLARGTGLTVSSLSISDCDFLNAVPRRCRIAARNIQPGDVAAWNAAMEWIRPAFPQTPRLDLTLEYALRPERSNEASVDVSASVAGLGALTIAVTTDGLDLGSLTASPAQVESAMRARLHRASVSYIDSGLIPLVLTQAAREERMNERIFRERIKEAASGMLSAVATSPQELVSLRRVVMAFVDRPERVEISVEPSQPVPFEMLLSQLQARGPRALRLFGVNVRLNNETLPLRLSGSPFPSNGYR